VGNFRDLRGQRFGRLAPTEDLRLELSSGRRMVYWRCVCDCGETTTVLAAHLTRGKTLSCGCLQREGRGKASFKHGLVDTTEYAIWTAMLRRCRNPNCWPYKWYGGRGIRVCERWQGEDGFVNFLADMGPRPEDMTLDRIDTNGHYEPANCRWVTQKENCRNSRATKIDLNTAEKIRAMHAAGSTQTALAGIFSISKSQVANIVHRRQWN
jgi:hypothetical protein